MNCKPGISACLIVKDEEAFIEECLRRLWKFVNEVIVVDTGSTDSTAVLARSLGAKVFHYPWNGSFSAARNFSLDQAQHMWVLVIDADELIDETSLEVLSKVDLGDADAYYIDVINLSDDPNLKLISKHVALFKNDPRYRYEGAIHERIGPAIARAGGKIGYLPLRVEHWGYLKKIREGKGKRQRNRSIILNEIRNRPKDPLLQFYLAQECFVDGELEEAAASFKACLAQVPTGSSLVPVAVLRLMEVLMRLSRWEEALELYETYAPRYPDYTDLHFLAGVLCRKTQDFGKAESLLLKAISLGDAPTQKYEMVCVGRGTYHAWSELADLYREIGRDKEAFDCFREALHWNPRYGRAARGLAAVALKYDAASDVLEYLTTVADLNDTWCAQEVWHEFYAYRAWDQCDAVAQRLEDSEQKYRMTLVRIRRGELEQAKANIRQLALVGECSEAAAMTGALLALECDDNEWGKTLLESLRRTTEGPIIQVLADLLTLVSVPKRDASGVVPVTRAASHEVLEMGWKLVDHAVELGLVRALETVGLLLARYGEPHEQRALRFGKVLWRYGLHEAAAEQCLIAGRQGVYDEESLLIIARYALDVGAREELIALLQKVIELAPGRAVPYLVLARTYKALGQVAQARDTLLAGLEHNSRSVLLQRELDMLRGLVGLPG